MRRRVETGRAFDAPTTQQMELNEPTLEGILFRAHGVFAQLLPKLEGAFEVRAAGRTIDVLAWVELERVVYQFAETRTSPWNGDAAEIRPSTPELEVEDTAADIRDPDDVDVEELSPRAA